MNKFAIMILAFIVMSVACAALVPTQTRPSNQVTLKAARGNTVVQMFSSITDKQYTVTAFPDGTTCKRLSGRQQANEPGTPMYFYRLDCNGARGYVNVLWVR